MVLDNYWKIVAGHTLQTMSRSAQANETGIYVYNTSGELFNVVNQLANLMEGYSAYNYLYRPNVMIGDGDATPRHDDYCLQHQITNMTNYTDQVNITNDDGRLYMVFTANGINNTTTTITIREIGIYKKLAWGYNNVDRTYPVLYVRELLENPVVVFPGQGFSLSLEWVQS